MGEVAPGAATSVPPAAGVGIALAAGSITTTCWGATRSKAAARRPQWPSALRPSSAANNGTYVHRQGGAALRRRIVLSRPLEGDISGGVLALGRQQTALQVLRLYCRAMSGKSPQLLAVPTQRRRQYLEPQLW